MPKKYSSLISLLFINIIRYYDYALFGLSYILISRELMSSKIDDNIHGLIFYLILASSSILRPIGAIIFGKISDLYSREGSVFISISLGSIAMIIVAFSPSYEASGNYGLLVFTFARMVFIFSLSGEIDSIKIGLTEIVSPNKKYFIVSFCSLTTQIGVFIASIMTNLAISFENITYLWRLNFLLGGAASLIILLINKNNHSKITHKDKNIANQKIFAIIKDNFKNFIISILIRGSSSGLYHLFIIFLINFFIKNIGLFKTHSNPSEININLIIIYIISLFFSGILLDKINNLYRTRLAYTALLIKFSITSFLVVLYSKSVNYDHYDYILLISLKVIIGLLGLYQTYIQIFLQELFKKEIRARMCGLSHSIGSTVISSNISLIFLFIWSHYASLSLIFALISLIYLIQLILLFIKTN